MLNSRAASALIGFCVLAGCAGIPPTEPTATDQLDGTPIASAGSAWFNTNLSWPELPQPRPPFRQRELIPLGWEVNFTLNVTVNVPQPIPVTVEAQPPTFEWQAEPIWHVDPPGEWVWSLIGRGTEVGDVDLIVFIGEPGRRSMIAQQAFTIYEPSAEGNATNS